MKHAIEILEERECALRAHIRECEAMSDRMYQAIGDAKNYDRLREVQEALKLLRLQLVPAA